MRIVSELNLDDVIDDFDLLRITAKNLSGDRKTGFDVSGWPRAPVHEKLTDGRFRGTGEIQSFGHLRADYIKLVHRNGNRGKDADDCHDDHEFN